MRNEDIPRAVKTWGLYDIPFLFGQRGFDIPQKFAKFASLECGISEKIWKEEDNNRRLAYVHSGGRIDVPSFARLNKLRYELAMNVRLRERYIKKSREWLASELVADKERTSKWSVLRRHHLEIAQGYALEFGAMPTKQGYRVFAGSQLTLEIDVETGNPGSTVSQVHMVGRLYERSGAQWSMHINWDDFLPGMLCYSTGRSAEEIVWGIRAYVTLSNVFAESFGISREG